MIACAVCGRPCIPMADWDVPVCIGCDDRVASIIEAGGAVAEIVAPTAVRPVAGLAPLFAQLRSELGAA